MKRRRFDDCLTWDDHDGAEPGDGGGRAGVADRLSLTYVRAFIEGNALALGKGPKPNLGDLWAEVRLPHRRIEEEEVAPFAERLQDCRRVLRATFGEA